MSNSSTRGLIENAHLTKPNKQSPKPQPRMTFMQKQAEIKLPQELKRYRELQQRKLQKLFSPYNQNYEPEPQPMQRTPSQSSAKEEQLTPKIVRYQAKYKASKKWASSYDPAALGDARIIKANAQIS